MILNVLIHCVIFINICQLFILVTVSLFRLFSSNFTFESHFFLFLFQHVYPLFLLSNFFFFSTSIYCSFFALFLSIILLQLSNLHFSLVTSVSPVTGVTAVTSVTHVTSVSPVNAVTSVTSGSPVTSVTAVTIVSNI